ncbi:hypothetical protein [Noviherbaspirillum soli]|uniref:hypothetical protein n=1 Tax=Noviherbaspirillum soli TaxID=1064518 RepID=UPI00188A7477|nr:hypothetical protein [Noviherbaspirillum soli]
MVFFLKNRASEASGQIEDAVPAARSLSPMETLRAGSGRLRSQPLQNKGFAIAMAGRSAGVDQGWCGRFTSLAEIIL